MAKQEPILKAEDLSKGMRQKLGISIAIIKDAPVILEVCFQFRISANIES